MDKLTKTIDENQCFYDDECIEFILDDLTEQNRTAMMRHTTTCEECADFLDDYLDFNKSLTDAGQIKVSDSDFATTVKPAAKPKVTTTGMHESVDLVYTLTPWPLGNLLLVASDSGLCKVSFVDDRTDPEELLSSKYKTQFHLHRDDKHLSKAAKELREYVAGKRHSFDLPLDMMFATTDFQREVLQGAMKIPFGQYTSYGELAQRIDAQLLLEKPFQLDDLDRLGRSQQGRFQDSFREPVKEFMIGEVRGELAFFVVEKEKIDIRAVIQLASSKLAECENGKLSIG